MTDAVTPGKTAGIPAAEDEVVQLCSELIRIDTSNTGDPDTVTGELEILRVSHEVELEQRRDLGRRRDARDDAAARASLARLADVARSDDNLIPAMLDAVRAEATLGEICGVLKDEWGVYTEPARF